MSDPRYMNPMTGPPGVAMEAHGFPMSSQNPLGFPNYLPSDYNQSSHRPHPSQHHAASTGHPYAADTSMGGGPSSSRRKARQQQQEQPQQQPQQQSPSLHQQPMHPQQQFHPMDHNAMQYPNYAVPPHPHDPIYTHHVATGIPYDPSGNFGHPNGSFSDPNLTSSGAHVEFDPMTGAPLPPRLPNSGANASSNGDPGVDSNRAQSSSKGAVPAGKEGRSAAASALVSTIVAVTNEKGNKVYKCPRPLCTKTYKNPNGLKYHLDRGACEVDHDVMEATTGISLHTDDPTALFNLQQQAQQALNGGYEAFAGGQKGSGSTGSADQRGLTAALIASDESLKIVHRPYGCKIVGCGKRYQNLNGLKYHAKTAHPGLDFKADIYVLFPF
ncbi:hypothetical protein BC830DRAFT_851312 [Chytriomyces sp. MP71]|nr:hypothetical protein BC830DRAFT_851312 [Chytriomyces sp. MP71]